jgi:ABC-type nitrate/sulfonate/bicarbonate transport system substrate-binding protein
MRFVRTLFSCSAAAFVLTAASLFVQAPAAQAQDLIRCAYPYWFGFAPTPVAMGMGYFEEEGLEVETVFDNDRANVLPGLEIGDIDCTMRTIGEHMSRPLAADSNLVVIGVIDVSVGADGVVGAPDINEVTDLVGKVFAGEINHPGTIMTAHALKQAGYDFNKDVEVRLIATDDASAVFEDSEVAAVLAQGLEDPVIVGGLQRPDHRRGDRQQDRLRGQPREVRQVHARHLSRGRSLQQRPGKIPRGRRADL